LTVACVPFLVELAQVSHHGRAELLGMLGDVADPERAAGPELADIRAALARAVKDVVPLVGDADPAVRAKAVYALAQTGAAGPVRPTEPALRNQ
jgi:HEAT repeat protein